eukprot:1263976-Rhodomonas_salina.1
MMHRYLTVGNVSTSSPHFSGTIPDTSRASMPKKPKGKAVKHGDTQAGSVLSRKLKRKLKKEKNRGDKQPDDDGDEVEEEEEV